MWSDCWLQEFATVHMLACALLPLLGSSQVCQDGAHWCQKIGTRLPLSRCYKHTNRCCVTCRRLALPLAGCPYGDKETWCGSLGYGRPISECYNHSQKCCQTCHMFDSGIPTCPFGDRASWCLLIGQRYAVSSCYDHERYCCNTCSQFRRNSPSCAYGDKLTWCSQIGRQYSPTHCDSNATSTSCCEACWHLAHGRLPPQISHTTTPSWSSSTSSSLLSTGTQATSFSGRSSPVSKHNTGSSDRATQQTTPTVVLATSTTQTSPHRLLDSSVSVKSQNAQVNTLPLDPAKTVVTTLTRTFSHIVKKGRHVNTTEHILDFLPTATVRTRSGRPSAPTVSTRTESTATQQAADLSLVSPDVNTSETDTLHHMLITHFSDTGTDTWNTSTTSRVNLAPKNKSSENEVLLPADLYSNEFVARSSMSRVCVIACLFLETSFFSIIWTLC